MRNWILLFIAAVVVAGIWYGVRTYARVTPPWAKPKFGTVSKGDIRVPITAAGLIEPARRIEVKSKASGEVIKIFVTEGSFVHEGDVLVQLKRDDEQRSVDRAQFEVDRADALLTQLQQQAELSKKNIDVAAANVDQLVAQLDGIDFDYNYKLKLQDRSDAAAGGISPLEMVNLKAQRDSLAAQVAAAKTRVETAKLDVEVAAQQVKQQETVVSSARKTLEDAQERLRETTIVSKYDALVTDVLVEVQTLVQSGTTSFTGGTPLISLADVTSKKVVAKVDEADFGRVLKISPDTALPDMPGLRDSAEKSADALRSRSGKVTVTVDAFPELKFAGLISQVEPQGNLGVGSSVIQFNVHVELTDDKAYMLPLGTQAQVEFTVESAQDVLRVPSDAVKNFEGNRGVYIRTDPPPGTDQQWGKRFVPCRFGITDGAYTQIIEVTGDDELKVDQQVYIQLPPERD